MMKNRETEWYPDFPSGYFRKMSKKILSEIYMRLSTRVRVWNTSIFVSLRSALLCRAMNPFFSSYFDNLSWIRSNLRGNSSYTIPRSLGSAWLAVELCISGATKSYIILLHYVPLKFGSWSDWEMPLRLNAVSSTSRIKA